MKKHDDYISGPHHYWIHFGAGLVFGAGPGLSIAGWLGLAGWHAFGVVAAIALGFAYSCGQWGEVAWKKISEWLQRWWPFL